MALCPWHGVCTLSFIFSAVTSSGPGPQEIGRNATSRLLLFSVFFCVVFLFFPPVKQKKVRSRSNLYVWAWDILLASFGTFYLCYGAGKQTS